jgi:hypothetical protein
MLVESLREIPEPAESFSSPNAVARWNECLYGLLFLQILATSIDESTSECDSTCICASDTNWTLRAIP